MLEGIIWILRTGAPWRDLPKEFGPWQTVYKRFNAWSSSALWQDILASLSREADLEAVLLDGSYVRVHKHAAGGKGGATLRQSAAAEES
jgi:transposase